MNLATIVQVLEHLAMAAILFSKIRPKFFSGKAFEGQNF